MADLFLLGRLLFGGFFLFNGLHHFWATPMLAQFAGQKGVPMPEAAVMLSGALLIVGGLCVLLGILPRLGLACIGLFLVGVTPVMHNFWAAPDAQTQQMDLGNFLKNVALLGSALMMTAIPTPWPFSVERLRRPVGA
jgi:putative oxidoreductase